MRVALFITCLADQFYAEAGVAAVKAGAHRIALGPLSGNPFPDARPEFFASIATTLSLGLDHAIDVSTPFLQWSKEEVICRGVELGVPLEFTLSCMNPVVLADATLPRQIGRAHV